MRILLDCDGVLADFVGAVCRDLSRQFGEFRPDHFVEYDLASQLGPLARSYFLGELSSDPQLCPSILPYQEHKGYRALSSVADVVVLTSPWTPPHWEGQRRRWLREHFDVNPNQVIFAPRRQKQFVFGDVLVEDHIETAIQWYRRHPDGQAFVMRRPWNSTRAYHCDMVRDNNLEYVDSLEEVYAAIT